MRKTLQIKLGQCTDKGIKSLNQDFIGAYFPKEPLLGSKGIIVAMADGISSSNVSQIASETAVSSFINDYYCTSEAQSVRRSAECVLQATNSWLFSQSQNSAYRFDPDSGYICTFSSLILKSHFAYLFHCGDTRVYRVVGEHLEQLTQDHRRHVDAENQYLTHAMGLHQKLSMDIHSFALDEGDRFLLMSDGVYEFISEARILYWLATYSEDLDAAAHGIVEEAKQAGSDDNLSIQIVRVEQLPDRQVDEIAHQISALPLPPKLQPRMTLDHFTIERDLYISSRSHVFLAVDNLTKKRVVIKTPSTEMRNNNAYLERFLLEEWIAKRISSPYVLKATQDAEKKHFLYLTTEYIEGQTLAQWSRDNPRPHLEQVRDIVEQISKGLQAFHRQEMLHQDIRPNNIMLDHSGTVKIIDFGSTKVAGIHEMQTSACASQTETEVLGTMQYSAPEYFLGKEGDVRSDLFSLAVIAYYLLCGKLPYGTQVANLHTTTAQRRLNYASIRIFRQDLPIWVDATLKKALTIQPDKRYSSMSEFIYDLRHPNPQYLAVKSPPLMEAYPVATWQAISAVLFCWVIYLLAQ
ncbi:bifunctional protein-serine/threonine kinase/phosphatase [Alteromonas sp. a30]|uniref:bifunctional protein-serine/threonine kinase/phosphatase n=1 Tax=Alteromonas sp. a30 TaxID=2730917 RepID=UPI00227E3066|nr:bifunctional protein-serine/threonine kinase/phosphatase [Alteromonas sp. a30]MCY7294905.1 bifunctional protein-serine/threonine kinase/phosphatase [Alteromonas sp. a30]